MKKSITCRISQELHARIQLICDSNERPITWVVEKALEAHLPVLEEKYKPEIEAYLAELNRVSLGKPSRASLNETHPKKKKP